MGRLEQVLVHTHSEPHCLLLGQFPIMDNSQSWSPSATLMEVSRCRCSGGWTTLTRACASSSCQPQSWCWRAAILRTPSRAPWPLCLALWRSPSLAGKPPETLVTDRGYAAMAAVMFSSAAYANERSIPFTESLLLVPMALLHRALGSSLGRQHKRGTTIA